MVLTVKVVLILPFYPKPSDVVEPWRWIALSQFRLPLFSSPEKKGIPAAFCYSNFESSRRQKPNITPLERERRGSRRGAGERERERERASWWEVEMLRWPIGGKEINGHFILHLLVSPLRPARKLGARISNLFRRSSRVVR